MRRLKISVALTTLVLIVLIMLLAQTVRHAKEKEGIRQFGLRQVAVARGIAARLEGLIVPVEKELLAMAAKTEGLAQIVGTIRALQKGREGNVSSLAVTDARGAVLIRIPAEGTGIRGPLGETELFQQIRTTAAPAVGSLPISESKGDDRRVMVIGVPRYEGGKKFIGVILAVFTLERFYEDQLNSVGEDSRMWLLDGHGTLLFDPMTHLVGRDIASIDVAQESGAPSLLREALLAQGEGYGEYRLRGEGKGGERHIVAYVPFLVHSRFGTVAIVTPYDSAIAPIRKRSFPIVTGAAVLILALIIAALAVVYAARRRVNARAAEERLREREEWQEKLLREKKTIEGIIEGSPIPTFVLNRNHKIILWNRACTGLTGFSAAEMVGTENQYVPFYNEKRPVIADLIIEKDFESIGKYYGSKKVKKSATVEGAYEATDFYPNLGGRNRHIYFLAAPIYDEKGDIIAAIETIQDVSREEELSKNLREYAENLQDELQENIRLREEIESLYNYLQSIVDSLPDRLYVLSGDGTIHYMSRDVKGGIGMKSQSLNGKPFLEIFTPELREFVMARWEEVKQGIYAPFPVEVKAKDGSRRTFLITTGPVKGTDRYVVVERDVTNLKNLEERFYESEKLAALGQLSAGIAHEVRNPLSSIKMSLQILEKRLNPTGNDLKRFRIAQREVERLEELVNDVLIFAKPAAPLKETTKMRKVIKQALVLAEKAILDKKIRVHTSFPDAVTVLKIDTAMLEQAFLNLILNAVDAMEPNGELNVAVRLVRPPDNPSVEVEIQDNGCGIEERDIPHLFNPFFSKKKYGTGLGLTQVKKMIDLHQGTIELFSRVGEGTRVRIRFPLAAEAPGEPSAGQ